MDAEPYRIRASANRRARPLYGARQQRTLWQTRALRNGGRHFLGSCCCLWWCCLRRRLCCHQAEIDKTSLFGARLATRAPHQVLKPTVCDRGGDGNDRDSSTADNWALEKRTASTRREIFLITFQTDRRTDGRTRLRKTSGLAYFLQTVCSTRVESARVT